MTILKYNRGGDILLLLLYALTLILILSSTVFGWTPKLPQRYGFHNSSSSRRILLSFANKSNDNDMPDKSDESSSSGDTNNNKGEDDDRLPLFSTSEVDHHASVLKLEAIFNDIDTKDKSASLLNSKDRVVLDSWMDWGSDDNSVPCKGDSCGDVDQCDIPEEYKVGPKPEVDVMAFLGIKRLEPLQVLRDWD